jgi:hypothetical protein
MLLSVDFRRLSRCAALSKFSTLMLTEVISVTVSSFFLIELANVYAIGQIGEEGRKTKLTDPSVATARS